MKLLDFFRNPFNRKQKEVVSFNAPVLTPVKQKRKYNSSKKTKLEFVKQHLIEKGQIDSWTAIQLYGATRLSAIIFKLRQRGYQIDSISNSAYDRNNQICNYTTYKLTIQD